jgi:hypothetical protein
MSFNYSKLQVEVYYDTIYTSVTMFRVCVCKLSAVGRFDGSYLK